MVMCRHDGIDIESDTSDDGHEEHDSKDEDDTANKFQTSDKEGEPPETFHTYLNHDVNDYNMIGRQEKLDEVFDTENKLPASLMVEMKLLTIMKK